MERAAGRMVAESTKRFEAMGTVVSSIKAISYIEISLPLSSLSLPLPLSLAICIVLYIEY